MRTSCVQGARQRPSVVEDRLDQHDAACRPAASRAAARGRARARRALAAAATPSRQSHTPRSVCVAGQRRVAQPGRQVVVQHRDRLGLRGDDEVAGREARRDRLRDLAHVALLAPARASCAHMITTSSEPDEPEPARVRQPAGGEQQERRERRRRGSGWPTRVRPARAATRSARVAAPTASRSARRAPRGVLAAACGAAAPTPAPAQSSRTICGDRPSSAPGTPSSEPRRRRLGPRRAGVRGLVERRRHPRQVQQEAPPKPSSAVAQQLARRSGARAPEQHEPRDAPPAIAKKIGPVVRVEHRGRDARSRRSTAGGSRRSSERVGAQEAGRHGDRPAAPTSAYIRASCAYWRQERVERRQHGGEPARRACRTDALPAQKATGMASSANSSESVRDAGLARSPANRSRSAAACSRAAASRPGAGRPGCRSAGGRRCRRRGPRRSRSRCPSSPMRSSSESAARSASPSGHGEPGRRDPPHLHPQRRTRRVGGHGPQLTREGG